MRSAALAWSVGGFPAGEFGLGVGQRGERSSQSASSRRVGAGCPGRRPVAALGLARVVAARPPRDATGRARFVSFLELLGGSQAGLQGGRGERGQDAWPTAASTQRRRHAGRVRGLDELSGAVQ